MVDRFFRELEYIEEKKEDNMVDTLPESLISVTTCPNTPQLASSWEVRCCKSRKTIW